MTAVIYARYSSDNQREESIEGQIRECTAYAEKNGITIVKHYIDRAISAKTDNRPEFQQVIKDSERGIFDIIIVWNSIVLPGTATTVPGTRLSCFTAPRAAPYGVLLFLFCMDFMEQ